MSKIKLSVIIPAYNEEKNINKGVLLDIWNYLKKQEYTWEVIFVDDKSTDSTLSLLRKFSEEHSGFLVLAEPHRGKGGSVIAGILKAEGDIVLFTDMDQATPLKEVEKFLPKFENGYDIVIGSRKGRKGAPLVRRIMAYGFSVLRVVILGLPYKDTQCGFKAFTRKAAQKIFSRLKVFSDKEVSKGSHVTAGFDLEVLYIVRKLKLKTVEVTVNWEHRETERINPVKDSLEGLKDLLKVRINAFKGVYKDDK
jgi:glycosyltransferase involved in cell wall biosynthesis